MAKRTRSGDAKTLPGRLRIVAGNWRSRVLQIADVPGLRPTSERIRETLFNWLLPSIEGARCLDLFAGTGALGLEALSRGAGHAVFVDNAPKAVSALKQNVESLGATNAEIQSMDAFDYVRGASEPFDILFVDPPFADERLSEVCSLVAENGLLAPGATVYLEQDRASAEPDLPDGWEIIKNKTAGNVRYLLVAAATHTNVENGE